MYGAEGPNKAFMACRTAEERRVWAINEEPSVLQAMTQEEFVGRDVTITDHLGEF